MTALLLLKPDTLAVTPADALADASRPAGTALYQHFNGGELMFLKWLRGAKFAGSRTNLPPGIVAVAERTRRSRPRSGPRRTHLGTRHPACACAGLAAWPEEPAKPAGQSPTVPCPQGNATRGRGSRQRLNGIPLHPEMTLVIRATRSLPTARPATGTVRSRFGRDDHWRGGSEGACRHVPGSIK